MNSLKTMVNPLCVNISNMFIQIFLIISYKNVMIRAALFYFGLGFFFPFSEKQLFLYHQEDKLLTNLLNQWATVFCFCKLL